MLKLDSRYMFGTDGSGNQKKIWINNYLYKVDSKFRDSTKEVSACSIAEAFKLKHVTYKRLKCIVDGDEKWCSVCKSYLTSTEDQSINLYNILSYYESFIVTNNTPASVFFEETCKIIQDFTKLNIEYIRLTILNMLVFDFLIANDDRHLSNIEIIMFQNGTFDIAPIFDNGHSFFRKDSMLTYKELEALSQRYKSKPFSTNQWKNIIDINYAKHIVSIWMTRVNQMYGCIENIPNVMESHKKIIRYRTKILLDR